MAYSWHNVELEAAKFLQKLIQESKDEPSKLATKLYVIVQHMKSSGKENSMPFKVISRAMEIVIRQNGLDIEVLKSSRLPTNSSRQTGDSTMQYADTMDQCNSHLSQPSFQELNSPSFTNNRFIPHQLSPYNPHRSFSQIPTQNSEGSYSGSFTNLLKSVRKKRANKENNDSSAPVNRHWTLEEDEALAKAWVSISEDSIVGVEQSSGNLCDRIFCAFNSHMKGVCSNDRNPNALACRWNQMHKECGKFQGYYDRIRRKVRSGTNLCDDIDAARTEFKSEEGISFRWDKAWAILKDEPKWNTTMLTLSNSKRKSSQIPDTSTSVRADVSEGHPDGEDPNHTHESQEETIFRPMGRKKARERRSKFGSSESKVSNDVVEYLSRIQSTLEAQTAFALDLAKGELELVQVKKQAIEDKRKLGILKEEERVMQFDWSKLPAELQEDWKDRQNLIRVKWMNEGRLTQRH